MMMMVMMGGRFWWRGRLADGTGGLARLSEFERAQQPSVICPRGCGHPAYITSSAEGGQRNNICMSVTVEGTGSST